MHPEPLARRHDLFDRSVEGVLDVAAKETGRPEVLVQKLWVFGEQRVRGNVYLKLLLLQCF